MLFFWPFRSNEVSISWRFALKQPSKHAYCARGTCSTLKHGEGRFASQWPTVHLRNHPTLCWWGTLGARWLLTAPMSSLARNIAERDGEGRKLRCSELGKKAFQWWDSNFCHLNLVHTEDFLPKQIRLLKSATKQYRSVIILWVFFCCCCSSSFFQRKGVGGYMLGATMLRPWLSSFLADYGFQFPQFWQASP